MLLNCNLNSVIIIPAYCPDSKLLDLIYEIRKASPKIPIVVVDDGNNTKYYHIFDEIKSVDLCFVIRNSTNRGKGASLKEAVKFCSNKFPKILGFITCDADGQHTPKDILNIAHNLENNRESLILGVRNFKIGSVPFRSRIGNQLISIMFFTTTGLWCEDTQTGLRGIPKIYEEIFISEKGDRYEFEMKFLARMAKNKIHILKIPIETLYIDNNKSSHFKPLRDSFIIFAGLIKYSLCSLASFAIDLGLFAILSSFIIPDFENSLFLSTVIARILSGIFNFLTNKKIVFGGNKFSAKNQFLKYSVLFVFQMIVSGILVAKIASQMQNPTIIKLLIDGSLFFASYYIQKRFIFC